MNGRDMDMDYVFLYCAAISVLILIAAWMIRRKS